MVVGMSNNEDAVLLLVMPDDGSTKRPLAAIAHMNRQRSLAYIIASILSDIKATLTRQRYPSLS